MGSETRHEAPPTGVDFHHHAAAHVKILDHARATVRTDRTKVALVGFAQATYLLAPFNDPEYEIWGVNQLYRHIPRADRWFEIHHNWNEHVVEGTDHAGWLARAPIPIYMKERVATIPCSLAYPLAEICGLVTAAPPTPSVLEYVPEENGVLAPVDPRGRGLARSAPVSMPDYFTSTIAFMLALAIHEGFGTIDLYGIDLTVGEEYDYQKPCAEFWIGLAMGRGIQVGIPQASALLKTAWRYGWESEPDWPIKLSEIQQRRALLYKEHDQLQLALEKVKGAIENNQFYHDLCQARLRGSSLTIKNPTGS